MDFPEIRFEMDLSEQSKFLTQNIMRQINFIYAKALTLTAKDCQERVRGQLPYRFTIRNSWVSKGIQIEPATKTRLVSIVGVRDDFMEIQNEGGTKLPKRSKTIAIPQKDLRPNERQIIKISQRPKRLLHATKGKQKPFVLPVKVKGASVIVRRQGPERTPLDFLYFLEPQTKIKERFGFEETVKETAEKSFPKRFEEVFNQTAGVEL
ncbi:MAG: hypothetical protein AB1405_03730 [Bdellovibrionota bacterium]